jgi:hypothetical protein
MLNLVVRSFGWIALLVNYGLVNNLLVELGLIGHPVKLISNFTSVMIGMPHIYLPFIVLMLAAAIRNLPRVVKAAAASLGSSRAHVFFAVTLPLTAPSQGLRGRRTKQDHLHPTSMKVECVLMTEWVCPPHRYRLFEARVDSASFYPQWVA